MQVPWNIDTVEIIVTKHFALGWMRKWGWDVAFLREMIRSAYKIEKIGKQKFEICVNKSGYKKIITVYYNTENKLVCITGSAGAKRL